MKIILIFIICMLTSLAVYKIEQTNESKNYCNYKMTPDCVLVYSEKIKKYAIRVDGFGANEYLGYPYGTFSKNIRHINILEGPEFFTDSCEAKYFCYKCVKQNSPEINDFKQVN